MAPLRGVLGESHLLHAFKIAPHRSAKILNFELFNCQDPAGTPKPWETCILWPVSRR